MTTERIKIGASSPRLFVSYARVDSDSVGNVLDLLRLPGLEPWQDRKDIAGSESFGESIVTAIRESVGMLLFCSDRSLTSRAVQQEIKLAWEANRPIVPLALDRSLSAGYPDAVRFWLQGIHWIQIADRPPLEWVPDVERALRRVCAFAGGTQAESAQRSPFDSLLERVTRPRRLWPERVQVAHYARTRRTLGSSPREAEHVLRTGDYLKLALDSDRSGHLLLLSEAADETLSLLVPSRFAPRATVVTGINFIPEPETEKALLLSGPTGQERLFALVAARAAPLAALADRDGPPRRLGERDLASIHAFMSESDSSHWSATSLVFAVRS